jgi:hypothetical protein
MSNARRRYSVIVGKNREFRPRTSTEENADQLVEKRMSRVIRAKQIEGMIGNNFHKLHGTVWQCCSRCGMRPISEHDTYLLSYVSVC